MATTIPLWCPPYWRGTIYLLHRTFLVRFGDILGEFGFAMVPILARCRLAKTVMARPSEHDRPPKRTKKSAHPHSTNQWLGVLSIMYSKSHRPETGQRPVERPEEKGTTFSDQTGPTKRNGPHHFFKFLFRSEGTDLTSDRNFRDLWHNGKHPWCHRIPGEETRFFWLANCAFEYVKTDEKGNWPRELRQQTD